MKSNEIGGTSKISIGNHQPSKTGKPQEPDEKPGGKPDERTRRSHRTLSCAIHRANLREIHLGPLGWASVRVRGRGSLAPPSGRYRLSDGRVGRDCIISIISSFISWSCQSCVFELLFFLLVCLLVGLHRPRAAILRLGSAEVASHLQDAVFLFWLAHFPWAAILCLPYETLWFVRCVSHTGLGFAILIGLFSLGRHFVSSIWDALIRRLRLTYRTRFRYSDWLIFPWLVSEGYFRVIF